MGGTNEKTVDGLRMHVSNGDVHVHDDARSIKFWTSKSDFKESMEKALQEIKESKNDGIIRINGDSRNDLCLVKEGASTYMFLSETEDKTKEIETFLKGC